MILDLYVLWEFLNNDLKKYKEKLKKIRNKNEKEKIKNINENIKNIAFYIEVLEAILKKEKENTEN